MSDRELLEFAAKAAKYTLGSTTLDDDYWNPLTDDGDALRLAVLVNLEMCIASPITYARMAMQEGVSAPIAEFHRADAMAATRRAIVRAAAELGRRMT